MHHVACANKSCENRGAPYTVRDGDRREHACPVCTSPMSTLTELPTPTVEPGTVTIHKQPPDSLPPLPADAAA